MSTEFDAIVLGLGGIGSGAAYWLAKSGARVAGFEQFEFGHARGESHDHSRIIRFRTLRRPTCAWRSWRMRRGPKSSAIATRRSSIAPAASISALETVRFRSTAMPRRCDAKACRSNDWTRPRSGADGRSFESATTSRRSFKPTAGSSRRNARPPRTSVWRWNTERNCTNVRRSTRWIAAGRSRGACRRHRYRAGRLIVAAGPWSAPLLEQLGCRVPLDVTKEQAMYFAVERPDTFAIGRFPIWIWMDDPSFYGFPVFGESGAIKITQDAGGRCVDPDTRTFRRNPAITGRVRAFVDRASAGGRCDARRQNVPLYVDAGSGLHHRSLAERSACERCNWSRPRLQVRIRDRPRVGAQRYGSIVTRRARRFFDPASDTAARRPAKNVYGMIRRWNRRKTSQRAGRAEPERRTHRCFARRVGVGGRHRRLRNFIAS